jgi:Mg2+ and Co2+ transporter CorA
VDRVPPQLETAQLSSIATALAELTDRVTSIADRYQGSPREDVAAALYEIERNLQTATRKLDHLLRDTR